jgi:hypothetical protein
VGVEGVLGENISERKVLGFRLSTDRPPFYAH